jgi:hypothetical protein
MCACCANAGEWAEVTRRIQPYELNVIQDLKFAEKAQFYLSDADEPAGVQLPSLIGEGVTTKLTRRQKQWTIRVTGHEGETGTLTFSLPAVATFFKVDPRDGAAGDAGPMLYKEVRMGGPVRGTGIFARGNSGSTRYRLVIQSRGNNCFDGDSFKGWTLQVRGPKADYSVYGAIAQ